MFMVDSGSLVVVCLVHYDGVIRLPAVRPRPQRFRREAFEGLGSVRLHVLLQDLLAALSRRGACRVE